MTAGASSLLVHTLVKLHGKESTVALLSASKPSKMLLSGALNIAALPLAFVHPWISIALYVVVACMWVIPDGAVEAHFARQHGRAP